MIPVFGVPFINRTDLFIQMLQSIDEEIGELIVIDNSADGVLKNLSGPVPTRVISLHHNLGVAASWNLIMKLTPKAPWWFIGNTDIIYAPGELAQVVREMDGFDGVTTLIGLSAFGVSRSAIKRAGFFDENFSPAYCEDNDWTRRCNLTGVKWKDIEPGSKSFHTVSATINSNVAYHEQNRFTYPENVNYYRMKWGGGIYDDDETYSTPFNKGGHPSDWTLDIDRIANLTWK